MKGHNWVIKSCEFDPDVKCWVCARCGIEKYKADEYKLSICTKHSYSYDVLIWIKGIRHKCLCRLGEYILRHS